MRRTRPRTFPGPHASRARAAVGLAVALVLALTATACGSGDNSDDGDTADSDALPTSITVSDDGRVNIPDDIKDKLKEHGFDLDKWRDGAWKNWDEDDWLRETDDFFNPVIEGLWNTERMREAADPDAGKGVDDSDLARDLGVTDPEPAPVAARAVAAPYHDSAPADGKVFFDAPGGSMVCSGTVVADPAHPGKSNLVWTAGHCVHAGREGGWYRNVTFVPSYNNSGDTAARLRGASRERTAPYGVWWSDGARTSEQWIEQGGETGGQGAAYDFAVIHVTPEQGGDGKSLEETVGSALPVDFDAPAVRQVPTLTADGYPAAKPFDGQRLFRCQDRPGRLSVDASAPAMYRIGCTMTGGASGGGWVAAGADGDPALVSNTSIGPTTSGWLAGPRLGEVAEKVYETISGQFADR